MHPEWVSRSRDRLERLQHPLRDPDALGLPAPPRFPLRAVGQERRLGVFAPRNAQSLRANPDNYRGAS